MTLTLQTYSARHVHPRSSSAQLLLDLLQSEYVGLYGEPDPNPEGGLDRALTPRGDTIAIFMTNATDRRVEEPVAIAGWTHLEGTTAVLRRMYVHFRHRGKGLSRMLLTKIEKSAADHGYRRLVLETGTVQTKAIALYSSAGYSAAEPFGFYAEDPLSVFLGKDL